MYPRTPHPASARRKSRLQNEHQELAFRDMNSVANTFSKSDRDFMSVLKAEEEISSKGTNKGSNVSRRYSVASKFAGPKSESVRIASDVTTAPGVKLKASKQVSLQALNERQVNSESTKVATESRKSTMVLPSKTTTTLPTRTTAAPFLQASHKSASKNQAPAAEHADKIRKSSLDMQKRSSIGREKVSFSRAIFTNKTKGALLKTASYWLDQVKLSEAMGKHGVSIGFFRLAVECEAEPVQLLREELIAYSNRYSIWSETIQQVLLCYGVTNEDRTSVQLHARPLVGSKIPCTADQNGKGMTCQDLERNLECSDEKREVGSSEDSVDASNANEAFTCLEENQRLDITGDVGSMDADTVAQEVVAYIMSSLVYPESSQKIKNQTFYDSKNNMATVRSEQNNSALVALSGGENSTAPLQESISIQSSADLGEAGSTGSFLSLNAWNVASNKVDSGILCGPVQQDIDNVHNKDSQMKLNGEAMCISMDLDDSVSDNLSELESKLPNFEDADSKQSNIQNNETRKDKSADDNENSNDITSSCEDDNKTAINSVNGSNFHATKIGERGYKAQEIKTVPAKVQTERPISSQLQGTTVSECQAKKNSSGNYQNGRDGVACVSDKENANNLLISRDNAAVTLSKPRRLSTSTPKPSTSTKLSNIEPGSRTRGKSKRTQALKLDNASSDLSSKHLTAAENILGTPTHDNTTGLKQITLDNTGHVSGDNMDATGSILTPGSAGLRRSARLRPGGIAVSTPGSVSTPRLQKCLVTPMKAQE